MPGCGMACARARSDLKTPLRVTAMHSFTFDPHVGPLPLRFGMTPAQVEHILGPPDRVYTDYFGDRDERRQSANIGYAADGRLQGVVFTPGVELKLFGHDLLSEIDPIAFLRQYD